MTSRLTLRSRGRSFFGAVATLLGALALSGCAAQHHAQRAALVAPAAEPAPPPEPAKPDWAQHFNDMSKGAILVSLDDRRLAYWGRNGTSYQEFPIAVPRADDLERKGVTRIVRRRRNPDWRPTPDMLRRNPRLPKYVGPGPHNPLGERALYLGWTYYAIHGTNNPGSIGSKATSGCFRMYPKHIEWLYDEARLGTPVRVVDSIPEFLERRASTVALNDPTAPKTPTAPRPALTAAAQNLAQAPSR